MPFDATGASGYFHYLVDIVLDSTTLRYADEDVSIKDTDGYFYQGRVRPNSALVRDLGTFLEAREQVSTFNLELDNSDGAIGTILLNSTLANRPVDLWIGEGKHKTNYTKVYSGMIDFPGGVEWTDAKASITIADRRSKDRKILPRSEEKYTKERYPNVEKRALTQPIPICFGDWSSAAASGASVPCVCIDTTVPKFHVAGHGIKSIDRYILNAEILAPTQVKNVSLSMATFELSGLAYDATSDTMSVNCKGLATANGTLIETPSYVLRSILTSYMGLTTTDLVGTAFNDVEIETFDYRLRRFINYETTSDVLVQDLLNETQIDLRFEYGNYSPKYRSLTNLTYRKEIRADDIVLASNSNDAADFTVSPDPDRMYANKVVCRYQYDPVDSQFLSATTVDCTTAQVRDGVTCERQMDFNWIYLTNQVDQRTGRELFFFSEQPIFVDAKMTRRILTANLADLLLVSYGVFPTGSLNGQLLQVRRIETDLGTMTARVNCYNVFSSRYGSHYGVWTADDAPIYDDATTAERNYFGFWTDADGYAKPGDYNSETSHWF